MPWTHSHPHRWSLFIVIPAVIILTVLWATFVGAQETECVNISPRTIGEIIRNAAEVAASKCPQAPACICPEIPRQIEVCRQNWRGNIVRCKKFAWTGLPK